MQEINVKCKDCYYYTNGNCKMSLYIFADIIAMTLIGKTARMYVNMPPKGDA